MTPVHIYWNFHSVIANSAVFHLLSFSVLLIGIYYIFLKRGSKYPPGPRGYPIIGFLPDVLNDKPHEVLDKFAKQYGEVFSIKIAGSLYIVLNSYEAIRAAYVEDGINFVDRPQGFTLFGKFFEFKAMAVVNGEEWRIHRKILSAWMKAGNGQKALEASAAETAKDLKAKIRALNSQPVDMYPIFANAAMDIIGSLVCGERLATTQPEVAQLILTDLRRTFQITPPGEVVISGRIVNLLFNPFSKKRREFQEIQNRLFSLMKRFVQEHKDSRKLGISRDYIDAFLTAQETFETNQHWFDLTSLVVNMLLFFVSGTDTTSSALYFAMYLMAKHPEIQTRCQMELDENVGRTNIRYMDRKRLPYVVATLNEVYRYASIGGVPQARMNHCRTHFQGWDIPANTTFITNLWTSTHDPKYFPNPNNFDPGNFFGKDIPRELFSLPFSLGKRNCPAEQLTRLDIFLIFSSIIQDFSIKFPQGVSQGYESENFQPGFTRVLMPFKIILSSR